MILLSKEKFERLYYNCLYEDIETFQNVIIHDNFHTIIFTKGIQEFNNKYFIRIVGYSNEKQTSLKTGISYTSRNNWQWVYEVSKEEGNNIYKTIKNSEKTSKNNNLFYKWNANINLNLEETH